MDGAESFERALAQIRSARLARLDAEIPDREARVTRCGGCGQPIYAKHHRPAQCPVCSRRPRGQSA